LRLAPESTLLAIANALEGVSRAEAARLAGMERQALRDAVVRYNAEGIAGLCRGHRGAVPRASRGCAEGIAGLCRGHRGAVRPAQARPPPRLSEAEQAALMARVFRGPDPERDGVSAWTRADLCGWLGTRFGKPFHPSSLSRVLRRLALSRQKTRPVHPQADPKAQERFRKRGCATL
jgi:transposase